MFFKMSFGLPGHVLFLKKTSPLNLEKPAFFFLIRASSLIKLVKNSQLKLL